MSNFGSINDSIIEIFVYIVIYYSTSMQTYVFLVQYIDGQDPISLRRYKKRYNLLSLSLSLSDRLDSEQSS